MRVDTSNAQSWSPEKVEETLAQARGIKLKATEEELKFRALREEAEQQLLVDSLRAGRKLEPQELEQNEQIRALAEQEQDARVERIQASEVEAKLAKFKEPTKVLNRSQASGSGVVNSTGAAGMLRFRLEQGGGGSTLRALNDAIRQFDAVCARNPFKEGAAYVPKAVIEARDELLRMATLHLRALGVSVRPSRSGETLIIEPSLSTDLGRYAHHARKVARATVDFDPLERWICPGTRACYDAKTHAVHISLDAIREGESRIGERHEFIHAAFAHYCRGLAGNSVFHGDVRANKGTDLFPNEKTVYSNYFSLEENVTYGYEILWAGQELKGLCDALGRGQIDNSRRLVADFKAAFDRLRDREVRGPGYRITTKTFATAERMEKLLRDNRGQAGTVSFAKSGTAAYLEYLGNTSSMLMVDFCLSPPPADWPSAPTVLRVVCRDREQQTNLEIQISDPAAVRKVSDLLASADPRSAALVLGRLAQELVLPRITATTHAASDLLDAHSRLYRAIEAGKGAVERLSTDALGDTDYLKELSASLDPVFRANRDLQKCLHKHSRA